MAGSDMSYRLPHGRFCRLCSVLVRIFCNIVYLARMRTRACTLCTYNLLCNKVTNVACNVQYIANWSLGEPLPHNFARGNIATSQLNAANMTRAPSHQAYMCTSGVYRYIAQDVAMKLVQTEQKSARQLNWNWNNRSPKTLVNEARAPLRRGFA